MSDCTAIGEILRELLEDVAAGRSEAVLTTVSPEGEPHAVWMGTVVSSLGDEILTITSPDSEKVRNIRLNPRVEWMFSDPSKERVIYLKGRAEEITDAAEIKAVWDALKDKRRAYFLDYFNSGIGFMALRTRIERIVYCVPTKCEKNELSIEEFLNNQEGS